MEYELVGLRITSDLVDRLGTDEKNLKLTWFFLQIIPGTWEETIFLQSNVWSTTFQLDSGERLEHCKHSILIYLDLLIHIYLLFGNLNYVHVSTKTRTKNWICFTTSFFQGCQSEWYLRFTGRRIYKFYSFTVFVSIIIFDRKFSIVGI